MARYRIGLELTDDPQTQHGAWLNRGERTLYESAWVRLVLADVVMPDGTQVDHHVVRMPGAASGTIIVRDEHVLLLYRHRFVTDTWGWEIPAGAIDAGESAEQAAVREAAEESGWRPSTVTRLCSFNPTNGISDSVFHIFVSRDAVDVGEPTDLNEASRVEWFTVDQVRAMLVAGEINDGLSFGAIAYALATAAL